MTLRLKLAIATAAAVPVLLLAFSTGAPIKHTGVVDGGLDCAACHGSFGPANSDPQGSVVIEGLEPYTGSTQQLRITIKHPLAERTGFQLTARFVNGNGTLGAGNFEPIDNTTKVVCDDGSSDPNNVGSPGPCSAEQLQWIEHAAPQPAQPGTGVATYNIQWRPPANENGAVVFYVSAVAAWGTGSAHSERVYDATARADLSTTAQCGITDAPVIRSAVNAGPHAGPFSSNSMVEVYGSSFQPGSRTRQAGAGDINGNAFPDQLSCIAVEIGGKRAAVTYVQQDQINIQAPTLDAGPYNLIVIANPGRPNELRSALLPVVVQAPSAPSFFTFGTTKSVAALFGNSANVVARPTVVAGASPAKPGDIITLWGTGFGPTNPAYTAGQIVTDVAPVAGTVRVTIGGQDAPVSYAGLSPQSISGLYQINVQVPAGIADGDQPIVANVNGVTTQDGVTIPIQH